MFKILSSLTYRHGLNRIELRRWKLFEELGVVVNIQFPIRLHDLIPYYRPTQHGTWGFNLWVVFILGIEKTNVAILQILVRKDDEELFGIREQATDIAYISEPSRSSFW
jgi:hypothetical protein